MKSWQWDLLLFTLASPVFAVRAIVRTVRRLRFLRTAVQPNIVCRTCGGEISLVGVWRCSCGYTSRSHLLRYCPGCGAFPRMIRCYRCGETRRVQL
jgi:hypothetical protein